MGDDGLLALPLASMCPVNSQPLAELLLGVSCLLVAKMDHMVTLDPAELPKETFPQSTGPHSEGKLWPSQASNQEQMCIKGVA